MKADTLSHNEEVDATPYYENLIGRSFLRFLQATKAQPGLWFIFSASRSQL